ncbi:MAG: prepilin-type N-terminal cleavage/methylation domain-containing protein [Pseudomonadota bacterium]
MTAPSMTRFVEKGLTLIELLVVMAVLGLIVGGSLIGVSRVRRADLRSDAGRTAAALRSAFDRAAATGAHHRVVLDLENDTFRIERCEGKIRLRRSVEEAREDEEDSLAERQAIVAAPGGLLSPMAGGVPGAPAAPSKVGKASCAPIKGRNGTAQKLHHQRGISFSRIYVAHLDEPARDGTVSINFFPSGRGERAVVEVSDEEATYSLLVHPFSGRVEIIPDEWSRPEEFVERDDEDKETAP